MSIDETRFDELVAAVIKKVEAMPPERIVKLNEQFMKLYGPEPEASREPRSPVKSCGA